jgi:guanylate kinase
MSKPSLIVISAPSGCGKTTIARELRRRHPEIEFSVSATTRKRRLRELHGKDYFFLSKEEFERKIEQGELVEWEEIYGDCYGTLKSEVERVLLNGKMMLFDVDVKGALSIKCKYPDDAVLVFVKPPSMEVLKRRLTHRETEDSASLAKRFARMPMEMEKGKEFDFEIVNDDVTLAVARIEKILGLDSKHAGDVAEK